METLKKSLVVILGVLLISSFVATKPTNQKEDIVDPKTNAEMVKRLIEENKYEKIEFFRLHTSIDRDHISFIIAPEAITYLGNFIIIKIDEEVIYIDSYKISMINSYKNKKGLQLRVQLM